MKKVVAPEDDPLVHDVVLVNKLPFHLHKYLSPFLFIYMCLFFTWSYFLKDELRLDYALVILISLVFLQALTILSCFWSCNVRVLLTCSKVYDPNDATFVKVVPTAHNGSTELVELQKSQNLHGKTTMWFEFQKALYIYDGEEKKRFAPISFPVNEIFNFYQSSKGFSDEEELENAKYNYGNNEMEMAIPEFKVLFIERATAPFFVFQVFCVILWCLDEYWYYSLFTLFMLVGFEASLVYQQLRNMSEIRKMGNKPHKINVYRSRKWRVIDSDQLVAGDIISLVRSTQDENKLVPCDLLLLRGRLIVDEAMLTGESVPQMKEPLEEGGNKDTVLDLEVHSRVHLISGGTRIVQHDPPAKPTSSSSASNERIQSTTASTSSGVSRPNDNGCIGYVLRTGFNTSQGKLLRTILFGVKRVTANNLETFAFIVFLLIFAIVASSYVWIVGSQDAARSKYKLLLNCILILTSVVPPELPIVLSLAVNSSLLALSKMYVYCTEPFRIPFAGKIDICCFDKTGTLTSDSLQVEGIAGTDPEDPLKLCQVTSAPDITQKVVASCHALANIGEELIGDPLEQAMLKAAEWKLTKADVMIPKKKAPTTGGVAAAAGDVLSPLKILHRFHFSSALKRMSTLVSEETANRSTHLICTKGAAEVLKNLFDYVPPNYDEIHQELAHKGARVLALGIKDCGRVFTSSEIRSMDRDEVERGLQFAGFIVVSSPLKHDSKAVIHEIKSSSHLITMITGDNPLTACHVGRVLKFMSTTKSLLLSTDDDGDWAWKSVTNKESNIYIPLSEDTSVIRNYDLCLTGEGLAHLIKFSSKFLNKVLPAVRIFARVSPKQKEQIIILLKQLGYYVLMCGDGTNDVGALKHAHAGVALLSGTPPSAANIKKKLTEMASDNSAVAASNSTVPNSEVVTKRRKNTAQQQQVNARSSLPRQQQHNNRLNARQERVMKQQQKLRELINEIDFDDEASFVKLGDASVAAPFSYKLSSISAVCHIVKQGRCTLVTTLQMFKILALNALILAYSQSVLSIDGVKFSDGQATLQGLLLAGCFLFISRAKPLRVLSKERPLPNIFNLYTILTVTFQFAIHFVSLFYLVREAKLQDPDREIDYEADFKANILNSTVYILTIAIQIATFAINYRGSPFMESIWENKSLLYSLMTSASFLFALLFDFMPDVNNQFEIVHFETHQANLIAGVLTGILVSTWMIDRTLRFIFGSGRIPTANIG